jgi:pimeloyl-ACP methyl ester carboxylesterase
MRKLVTLDLHSNPREKDPCLTTVCSSRSMDSTSPIRWLPRVPTISAIVFVHGFAGSPTGTWCDFHGLTEEYAADYPWWQDATLFFYSYDSTKKPIHYNAVRLLDFLKTVLAADPKTPLPGPNFIWKYQQLLLVGHSEGAVVIRRTILNQIEALAKLGCQQNVPPPALAGWIQNNARGNLLLEAKLCFFAPAIGGTNFSGVLGFVHGVSSFFSALASSSLVRNELLQESPILKALRSGTEQACTSYPNIHALSAQILFGSQDQVVYTDKYDCDEFAEPFAEDHDHFSVCKPKYAYKRPLEFVRP